MTEHRIVSHSPEAAEDVIRRSGPLSATTWGIVPIGSCGSRLWNRLPLQFARLLATPETSAHVVVPADVPLENVWAGLARANINDIQVCAGVPDLGMSELPALAPPGVRSVPREVRDALRTVQCGTEPDATAVRAGVLQCWDDLTRSHECAQSIEGDGVRGAGDYWHAIMHRREPDYSNAKYWFRRVGQHDIFADLAGAAAEILARCNDPQADSWSKRLIAHGWDPLRFVDLCQQQARDEGSPLGLAAREIQWAEMLLLLEATLADALD